MATTFDWPSKRIIVTGGAGFLGQRLLAALRGRGVPDNHLFVPLQQDFDLTEKDACQRLYRDAFPGHKADVIIHLAAEVGGIGANLKNPGRYFYANMAMALHLIEQARVDGLVRARRTFVQVGTICAYPKFVPVPFKEDEIWSGYPEETNAPYGVAKKAAGRCSTPTSSSTAATCLPAAGQPLRPARQLQPESSHVIPALIRKCARGQGGRGRPHRLLGHGLGHPRVPVRRRRAEGIVAATESWTAPTPVNLGSGLEIRSRTSST
jgi:GDP-L-fucose synthase